MHAHLKADMKQLNDSFTSVDYKQEKRQRKGKDAQVRDAKKTEDKKKLARQEKKEKRKQEKGVQE
jgi:hypothetical protein